MTNMTTSKQQSMKQGYIDSTQQNAILYYAKIMKKSSTAIVLRTKTCLTPHAPAH